MKAMLGIFAQQPADAELTLAYLGRLLTTRMRPLSLHEALSVVPRPTFIRYIELELLEPRTYGPIPLVADPNVPPTCMIIAQQGRVTALFCLRCGAVTHNWNDIEQQYCPRCGYYHVGRV